MNLVEFALWRFRHAEGVMKYVVSYNTSECKMNVKGTKITLTYKPEEGKIVISYTNDGYKAPITTTFADFEKTMTELGFYELRPDSERHSSSYNPKHEE